MIRALVIIEAAHLVEARALLREAPFDYSEELAAGTFVAAGSPTGQAPATHYWLSTEMSEDKWVKCLELEEARRGACASWAYDMETDPGFPWTKLAQMGLQPLTVEGPGGP